MAPRIDPAWPPALESQPRPRRYPVAGEPWIKPRPGPDRRTTPGPAEPPSSGAPAGSRRGGWSVCQLVFRRPRVGDRHHPRRSVHRRRRCAGPYEGREPSIEASATEEIQAMKLRLMAPGAGPRRRGPVEREGRVSSVGHFLSTWDASAPNAGHTPDERSGCPTSGWLRLQTRKSGSRGSLG